MPFYKVWYRNKTEPLEFSTPSCCRPERRRAPGGFAFNHALHSAKS